MFNVVTSHTSHNISLPSPWSVPCPAIGAHHTGLQKQNISFRSGTDMWQATNKGLNMQFSWHWSFWLKKRLNVGKERSENGQNVSFQNSWSHPRDQEDVLNHLAGGAVYWPALDFIALYWGATRQIQFVSFQKVILNLIVLVENTLSCQSCASFRGQIYEHIADSGVLLNHTVVSPCEHCRLKEWALSRDPFP